jgi:hypothetical protein
VVEAPTVTRQHGRRLSAPSKAQRLRHLWVRLVVRQHKFVLLLAIVVTGLMGWRAGKLRIDSDLRRLLPDDDPIVEAIADVEHNFGATGSLNVVVKGATPEDRRAFADAAVAAFADHPDIVSTDHRLPTEFFLERALYYLSDAEMQDLADRVRAWQSHELCQAAPDVCVEDPGPESAERLREFMENKRDEAIERTGFRDYYESDEVGALVFFLRPAIPSSDVEFSTRIVGETRDRLAGVERELTAAGVSGLRFNVVGPYASRPTKTA